MQQQPQRQNFALPLPQGLSSQQQFFRSAPNPTPSTSVNNSSDDPIIIESSGSSTSSNSSSCGPNVPPNVYFHQLGPSTSSNVIFQQPQQLQNRQQQQYQQFQEQHKQQHQQYNQQQQLQILQKQQMQLLLQQQQQQHANVNLAMQQQNRFLATGQINQRPALLAQQVLNNQMAGTSLLTNPPTSITGNGNMQMVRLQSFTPKQLANLIPGGSATLVQGQLVQHQNFANFNSPKRNPPVGQDGTPVLLHQELTPLQRQQSEKILKDEYYKRKHILLKNCVKSLAFKNAALCDEVARLNQRIQTVTDERKLLLRRLLTHEKSKEKRRASSVNARRGQKGPASAAPPQQQSTAIVKSQENPLNNNDGVRNENFVKLEQKISPGNASEMSCELNMDDRDVIRNIVDSVVTSGHRDMPQQDAFVGSALTGMTS